MWLIKEHWSSEPIKKEKNTCVQVQRMRCRKWSSSDAKLNGFKALHVKKRGGWKKCSCEWVGGVLRFA